MTVIILSIALISVLLIAMKKVRKNTTQNMSNRINDKNTITKSNINFNTPLGSINFSNENQNDKMKISESNEGSNKLINKLPEDVRDKMLKGDVKISNSVTKKVIKFQNGEKISEEETNSNNFIDKKAVQKCPNCGANIDLNLDECTYCRTKIN